MRPCDVCRLVKPDFVPFPLPVDPTGDAGTERKYINTCTECAPRLHFLMTLVVTTAQNARNPNVVTVGTTP